MSKGVLQGSVLSPLLFNLYIEDLIDILKKRVPENQIYAYADDFMIEAHNITQMRRIIQDILQWCNTNKMSLNHSKCGII